MSKLTDYTRTVQLNHLAEIISENRNIDIAAAKKIISEMSFSEYYKLVEASADIVPPSGRTLSPGAPMAQPSMPGAQVPQGQPVRPGTQPPQGTQPGVQPGQQPLQQPGVPGQPPTPGTIAQGVAQQLMPPGTNVPVIPGHAQQPGQQQPGQQQPTQEEMDLMRLKELAGISENCSAGATGAGGIAVAPAAMGGMKRRQQTDEHSDEYTPKGPPKTIVGDTKPGQASGELSANLAVRGRKTASRINNGMKR